MGAIYSVLSKILPADRLDAFYENIYKFIDHAGISLSPKRRAAFGHMKKMIDARPLCLSVETHSNCNSRCVFCVRRKIPPTNETMSMALFEKICSEYSQMGGGYFGFSPLLADPLLDPQLLERVRLIKDRFKNIIPHIFTNAIAIKRYSDDELKFLLSAMDHIDISVGGFNEQDYQTMFGVNQWASVREALYRLAGLNGSAGSRCTLHLHIRTNKKDEILRSDELGSLRAVGYGIDDICDAFSDWGGQLTGAELPAGATLRQARNTNPNPCFVLFYGMLVMPEGSVLACGCMDGNETLVIGNANDETLSAIYHGEPRTKILAAFNSGDIPKICSTCSFYSPYNRAISNPKLVKYDYSKSFFDPDATHSS